jgi:hypothetical protein
MEQDANNSYKLDIDAQVVRQLGDELITDPEQALLELVKNSFDADASWCNVTIDTRHTCLLSEILPSENEEDSKGKQGNAKTDSAKIRGRMVVEDSGSGMDTETIRGGWLIISLSPKRAFKAAGKVTPKFKRTPLGDKGLGRLGSMKLGDYLRITTHSKAHGKGLRITLIWEACKSGVTLSTVPVFSEEVEPIGKTGTTLEIFGLRDIAYWSGKTRLQELRAKLSTLISPFKSFDSFTIALKVNDSSVDLISLPQAFLDTSAAHFEMLWDDSALEMRGEFKLGLFRSQQNAPGFDEWIAADDGVGFWKFLENYKRTEGLELKRSKTKKWFIEQVDTLKWSDVPLPKKSELLVQKPGPVIAELYSFELDADTSKLPDFLSEVGEYILKNGDLVIEMNIGRFTQVIDNVVRNSEYWLEHAKRTSGIKALEIHAEIVDQTLVIWDTGLGVRRRVEQSLFEIFVTDMPSFYSDGYLAAAIVGAMKEWRIAIPLLAVAGSAALISKGCEVFCDEFKPDGLMIPRSEKPAES